jgi:cell volume regulation protein A
MDSLEAFSELILIVSVGVTASFAVRRLAERLSIPTAALLLVAAALLSDLVPRVGRALSVEDVQRVATVALILILFDGGMHVGWRRFRSAAAPILALGLLGTFATAGLLTLAAHWLLGFSWITAGLLGAALSPTDPAVTFSVLAGRQLRGRTGTILEGESGFNDPVGIALMIGMVELATRDDAGFSIVVWEFLRQMSIGAIGGVLGGVLLIWLTRRVPLGDATVYPLAAAAFAGIVFGATAVVHGSGFLAVFVAGIVYGDAVAPHKGEIERFHSTLASLAEVVAFVALGITIDLSFIGAEGLWVDGIVLGVLLGFAIRPLVVAALLLPARLQWGERLFVMWGGLKGAVPILLASIAVVAGAGDAEDVYGLVFVVVLFSVLVQGSPLQRVADVLRVPMRTVDRAASGARSFVVGDGALAAGAAIRALPLADRAWVGGVQRDGAQRSVDAGTVLEPGDTVLVYCDEPDVPALQRIFEGAAPVPGASRRDGQAS